MKRFLSLTLVVLMVISIMPMSIVAVDNDLNLGSNGCDFYNLIEKNDYNLAPGAVESEIIINDDSGIRRQVVHVVEVDSNNENISVMPSFKNISKDVDYTDQANWGIMEMSKQAAYVEETLGKNVVGAMNVCLSWDFTHPYGLLIYEGEVLCDNRFACDTCVKGHPGGGYLVIYKDGKAELRDAKAELTGEEWMAQTVCFSYLVKDGKNLTPKEDHSSDAAPRSVIGVKADGSLVIMMVDGRMAPYSTGFNTHEMAQMMLDLGCVDAINCDGGGSSTFITEREGTGELTVKSRFSDGAERATLTGILIVSKAVADGNFDHAVIEGDNKLVTPGSTVNFTTKGADSAGSPAEIPENISWRLTDSSMGTITDGVFVSNGKTGPVTVQMVYEGVVVGEATIEVVIPNSFTFVMSNITAPYTKTVSLDVVAKYGHTEVALKAGDVEYALSNAALGTISGIKFTATSDETIKGGMVTATLVHNRELTATANITLGKGSEIIYDFESGAESIENWNLDYKVPYTPDKYYFNDQISVVSKEDGAKVRNGNYALKITCDGDSITCMNWCQTKIKGMNIDLTDAVSLSFWIYIPEGSHGYEWDFGSAIPVVLGHEFEYGTGWQYLTVNVSDIGANVTNLNEIRLYHSDTNNAANGYNHYEKPNYYADVVYYIDDITVNYSSAVEDNDAPVISDVCVSHSSIDTPVAINGQDVNATIVAFTAKATDNVGNTNFTGLNVTSLVAYVDGNKVNAYCTENGLISTSDINLANGVHTVVFQIADNNGNVNMYKEYVINITGNKNDNTIKYVPANPTLKNVPNDSIVWMNLVATSIETVDKITTTIDLDQNSKWELDHMILANGFTATYVIDAETNDATITISKNGVVDLSGEAIIATMPIRVWSPAFMNNGGNEDASAYRLVSVMSYVQMGELIETTGEIGSFASSMQTISTEWNSTRLTSSQDKDGWHIHTEEPVVDKDATCDESGYIGRTYCEVCKSIVKWGETIDRAGHAYEVVNNRLVCNCGAELTTAGIIEIGDNTYFMINGKLQTGWQFINDAWYYFEENYKGAEGVTEIVVIDVEVEYTFNKGKLQSGVWITNESGTRYMYGPSCHRASGSGNIAWKDIDGVTYGFDNKGYLFEGRNLIYISSSGIGSLYDFDHGIGKPVSAIYNNKAYIDGDLQYAYKLVEIDGDYYFVNDNHTIAKDCQLYLSEKFVYGKNFEDGTPIPAGLYGFDADGKMIVKNGVYGDYLYKNGLVVKRYQLTEYAGSYYFINDGDKVAKNCKLYLSERYVAGKTFADGRAIQPGIYEFDAEGKMVVPELKHGVVDGYLYINDVKQIRYQLVEFDGNFYFINDGDKIAQNTKLYLSNTYVEGKAFTDGRAIQPGIYEFDAEGKMVVPELKHGVVDGYLYINDVKQIRYQLVEFDGNFYFINDGDKIAQNTKLYLSNTYVEGKAFTDGRAIQPGIYEFDAEGKMVVPERKHGVVDGYLYINDVKQIRYQLVEFDGNFYFINDGDKIAQNTKLYLSEAYIEGKTFMDGTPVTAGLYEFDAEGKMITGM